jgi:photosystem II stability/assembly factor-like uncharacterized protein
MKESRTVSSSPNVAYAGGASFWKTEDGGRLWKETPGPRRPLRIAATVSILYATNAEALFRSSDQGESWQRAAGSGLPIGARLLTLAVQLDSPAALFAGTPAGLFRSLDAGETWSNSGNGIPEREITAIALDPSNRQIVYAATISCPCFPFPSICCVERLYKSEDGGASWRALSLTLGYNRRILSISIDPRNGAKVVVGHHGGLEVSDDRGETWHSVPLGFPATGISAVLFDPKRAKTLYAAADFRGVLVSRDGGEHWSDLSRGLPPAEVPSLALDASADLLHAATYGGGVFELDLRSERTPRLLPFR